MSPAAGIISTNMPDGPGTLPAFICVIAFLTISMVIGMSGDLPLVVDKPGGLGPSQTQRWEAFGSALTRPRGQVGYRLSWTVSNHKDFLLILLLFCNEKYPTHKLLKVNNILI